MRRVGLLPTESDARTFYAALLARGIENTPEAEDGGRYSIWVHDDDHLAEAGKLLARFQQSPNAPEFREAIDKAARLEAEAEKAERRRRSTVIDDARLEYERTARGQAWVPFVVVALCIAAAVLVGFMRNPRNPALEQNLFISEVPFHYSQALGKYIFLPEVRDGQVWRLITPIFLHGDVLHILFNMIWLVQLGRFIEIRFGPWKLLALILIIAVGSNLAQYLAKYPNFGGMSGVNYGLFGFLWIKGKFGRQQTWQLEPQVVQLMLLWMVLCYTGLLGPVANYAHTAGLIIGAILGFCSARLVPWLERESST